MGFFDKIKDTASVVGNKVKETGSAVGNSSKIAIEKQKLKNSINKEKIVIDKKYAEIGKKYVELYGNQPIEEFVELINDINIANDNIVKLTNQLNSLDNMITCSCGTRVSKESKFCPTCGNAIIIAETVGTEVVDIPNEDIQAEPVEVEVQTETETNNNTEL